MGLSDFLFVYLAAAIKIYCNTTMFNIISSTKNITPIIAIAQKMFTTVPTVFLAVVIILKYH